MLLIYTSTNIQENIIENVQIRPKSRQVKEQKDNKSKLYQTNNLANLTDNSVQIHKHYIEIV